MPPKGQRSAGAKAGEEQREAPLQAVLFADSYETRFHPFTLERPRCLLPLANTPLIEYSLEFLASVGVEEVFLYCGNHTEAVEKYLNTSKWLRPASPFTLEILRSPTARSIGDCMRDLHQKERIVGDFIAVYGDVVANLSLETALAAHRARREKDKKAIMTMVLREIGTGPHRTKPTATRAVFVLDAASERCLHYESVPPRAQPVLDLSGELLAEHTELDVREDLLDCGIDICTPEVLAQYTDNFDWQLPRRGFLRGVLKDWETFQLSVHAHVVGRGYAARVESLRAYEAVSRDVLGRWVWPVGPEANLAEGMGYSVRKGKVLEDGVEIAEGSVVERCVVGRGTKVAEGARLMGCVVGRRCVIGKRVRMEGAYIWDDVRIEDDAVVEKAIVANEATVGKGCMVERGALISYGVRIADGTTVLGDRRLTRHKRKRDSEIDESAGTTADPKIVNEDSAGYHLALNAEEEEVAEALLCGLQNMSLSVQADDDDNISTFSSDDETESNAPHLPARSSRSNSFASATSADDSASAFHAEAVASLFDALQNGQNAEDMQLELRALTLADNADGADVRRALAAAMVKRIAHLVESEGKSPREAVGEVVLPYKLLVSANVRGEGEQGELLLFVQRECVGVKGEVGGRVLKFAAEALMRGDLVEVEGLEVWWGDGRGVGSTGMREVREETRALVEALLEESSEEEEEEEEESEED